MPSTAENQDIANQPKIQGYSSSSSNPVPAPPIPSAPLQQTSVNPPPKKPNTFFTLGLMVFGLLFLFFIFLGVLNYFNIVPLEKNFPFLSFLPNRQLDFNKILTKQQPNEPQFTETKLKNQSPPADIKAYQKYAGDNFGKAFFDDKTSTFSVEGVVSGFDDAIIQLVTIEGIKIFNLEKDTIFEKILPTTSSAAEKNVVRVSPNMSAGDFFKELKLGFPLRVVYAVKTSTNTLTLKEAYILESKPVK